MAKSSRPDISRDDVIRSFALLTSTDFLNKFIPILDPELPKQPELRWLTKVCVEYHEKNKCAPTFDILRSKLAADRRVKDEDAEIIKPFIAAMEDNKPKRREAPYYAEVLERFLQTAYISTLVREVTALVNNGETDEAEEKIAEAQVPKASDISLVFLPKDVELLFRPETDEERLRCVPTGIDGLDLLLRGGLRPGELGVFMAPTGYGKSMALVHVAVGAWKKARNIIHFSFENTEEESMRRYVSNMTGATIEDISMNGGEDSKTILKLKRRADDNGSMVAISRLIGSRTDINVLLADLNATVDVYGFEPDLIIVDYGDLMIPTRPGKNRYEDMQTVFAELRDLATVVGLPLWTATQSNREGLEAKRLKLSHISESLGKAMTADCIVGISRPEKDAAVDVGDEETDGDVAEMKILKLRRGAEGHKPIRLRTNFALARFDEVDSPETSDQKDIRAKKEVVRKTVAKKASHR